MSTNITEYDRMNIANVEYDDYTVYDAKRNHVVKYGPHRNKVLGTLVDVVDDKSTGLKMYVVKTDENHYSVLFQGSQAPDSVNHLPDAWKDWGGNDASLASKIIFGGTGPTPQLEAASKALNTTMAKYPNASFDVYGHSLGSMCAQYAAVTSTHSNQIKSVYAYEGPNIYSLLSQSERSQALKMKNKIHNYIDRKDIVSLGYANRMAAVGHVRDVYSKDLGLDKVSQHLWGGYQWQKDGSLPLAPPDMNEMKNVLAYYRKTYPSMANTRAGRFVLDYIQSQYCMDAFVSDTSTLENDINTIHDDAVQLLQSKLALAITTMTTNLNVLNPDSINHELYQRGLTNKQALARLDHAYEVFKSATTAVNQKSERLQEKIQQGIQHAMDTDTQLADSVQKVMDKYYCDVVQPQIMRQQTQHRITAYLILNATTNITPHGPTVTPLLRLSPFSAY
ncbi:DUF2974 domain-containing protein [Alloscardovia theropitheci]|uniref:DUF2974 domain-containing protein n=1 Tax=Alloscardovia theropitheci TaxID=2496842 RepID=A0A4R0QZU1_9BIFI|nr:Mbeg1-like protein [Alloscardovia theropitheci]TCD54216.1 DUF2974 domain-containing protein [Alloscardovia theropitheci]